MVAVLFFGGQMFVPSAAQPWPDEGVVRARSEATGGAGDLASGTSGGGGRQVGGALDIVPASIAGDASTGLVASGSGTPRRPGSGRTWVKHRVIPGERVAEIAKRYGVNKGALLRWNKLDARRPRLRVGQELKIWAKVVPPAREQMTYEVQKGDSWIRISRKFKVNRRQLRRWNRRAKNTIHIGQRLRIWVDVPEPARPGPVTKLAPNRLPFVAVPQGAKSVGTPNRGKISRGIQLPRNDALYVVSKPEQAWGTTHTFESLQLAVANFRQNSTFAGDVVVGAVSRRGGGRLRPHRSHQSGRDVDIRLPLARGVKAGTWPAKARQVDWDAAWALIHALVQTGHVEYIFLNYRRQSPLRAAALRAGIRKADREKWIQYPNRSRKRVAVIRHAEGHTAHFHVRFHCGERESRCKD